MQKEIYLDEGLSIRKFLNKNNQNSKILNLNNKKLPCIPIDIIMLKENLEELYLKNNNLTKIPSFLGKLKKLQKVDLSKNRINSIDDVPDEIFELPNLEILIISVKHEKIPSIEISKNKEGRWIVKYKNTKDKNLKKVIGIEKNGNLIIEFSKKGIEEIRQKRIHKLKSKTNDILINYLFVYNNGTQLSDKFLRKQVTKDQDSLSRLYKKENKLRKASHRFGSNNIKTNHYKIDYFRMDDLNTSQLNASRSIQNERFNDFAP